MKHSVPGRFRLRGIAAACALLCVSASAPAIDAAGNYAIWGVGQASCHQFGKAYAADELAPFKAYLAGYLTAYNALTKDVNTATGNNTLKENLAVVAAHCTQHPMDSYEQGIQALIASTAGKSNNGGAAWARGTAADQ